MIFYATLFHGLKIGFEYLPYMGRQGTVVLEFLFLRAVFIFGAEIHESSNVQDGD